MAAPDAASLREQRIIERLIAADEARDNLLAFARLMLPDPAAPDDPGRSQFQTAKHHRALADALHKVESGEVKRLATALPPRMGKTTLVSRLYVPWFVGRNPDKSIILATYGDTFAADHGRAIRAIMDSPQYRLVFPDVDIRNTLASQQRIITPQGGTIFCVGRGTAITGRGGDLIADDLLKDRTEADSATTRDALWSWWHDVFLTRLMDDAGRVVLCGTRWHFDDLQGRLFDKRNDHYRPEEAKQWWTLNLPALAERDDPLGRKPGESLWPERFSKQFLEDKRRSNPAGFSSLYQGSPGRGSAAMVQDGSLKHYESRDFPKDARIILAADFAVSGDQSSRADRTCIAAFGVTPDGTIYLHPDLFWRRATTDQIVEAMVSMIRRHKPLWFAVEKHIISKSIGPFLRKRMLEEQVHASFYEIVPAGDKQMRFQGMAARIALGQFRFPHAASWAAEAKKELTEFPDGAHDDLVDCMSLASIAIEKLLPATQQQSSGTKEPEFRPGSLGAIRDETRRQGIFDAGRSSGF